MKKVTIYSTPTCHHCHLAKDYFAEHKIPYTEYNVSADLEKRREMVEKSDQLGVPVIQIGDEIIVGFNEPLAAQMLGIKA